VSRPARPLAQLAARAGLWAAVGIGCAGGIVGLVRGPGEAAAPVVEQPATGAAILPAPVAGIAELAVGAWLGATESDRARLDGLFIEPPSLPDVGDGGLTVGDLTTVAGERLDEGHWAVTVAARVTEQPTDRTDDDGGGLAAEGGVLDPDVVEDEAGPPTGATPVTRTWYVEVSVVGDDAAGLAVLATPGVLPGPPEVPDGWRVAGPALDSVPADDPVAAMAEDFLNALLVGRGVPSPYLAAGVDVRAASPPLFEELTVERTSVEELDGGEIRVWVEARATTPRGTSLVAAYEIKAVRRDDRWDVLELWGSPSVAAPPPDAIPSGTGT
jgi:hypothetical protein